MTAAGPTDTVGLSLSRLADEQAALRQIAVRVAEGAQAADVFVAVAEAVVRVFDIPTVGMLRYERDRTMKMVASIGAPSFPVGSRWSLEGTSVSAMIYETGLPARIEDFSGLPGDIAEEARRSGFESTLGVPIAVDGAVWGAVIARTVKERPFPADVEVRLARFTELVAAAIANAESQDSLRLLAEEQAALHRVAALVAHSALPAEVFAAVAEEVARLLDLPYIEMVRYKGDTGVVIGASGDHPSSVGSVWSLDSPSVVAAVRRSGRPERIDDYSDLPGEIAELARSAGFTSCVGAPIIVEGATWGAISAANTGPAPIADAAERRLAAFTDLVAAAISNLEAREELQALANEQAALRRLAMHVARGASSAEILSAVTEEAARVVGVEAVGLLRFEPDGVATLLAQSETPWDPPPVGTRIPLDGENILSQLFRTRQTIRVDDWTDSTGAVTAMADSLGIRSSVATPIIANGQLWGTMIAVTSESSPLPTETETRIAGFSELVGTAVSNAEFRDSLRRLADEQAALRRVALLVAEGAEPGQVFAAVAKEAADLADIPVVGVHRYEGDGTFTLVGVAGETKFRVGSRWSVPPDGSFARILATGRPARRDDYSDEPGLLGEAVREDQITATVDVPIIVDGKVWGFIVAAAKPGRPNPDDVEQRLAQFTELVATAVSNAATRAELIASRARIVAAGDEARRRIERNLHDGTQQRLIALGLDIQRVRATIPESQHDAHLGLERVEEDLQSVLEDLRELSRGLHPPLLSRRGLNSALRALVRDSPIPVELEIDLPERPSVSLETAVYYVVAEALTNAIRHSQASVLSVRIETDHAGEPFGVRLDGHGRGVNLHVTVADDGIGGADPSAGSGLMGLTDRVDALGGRFALDTPRGGGTRISIALPFEAR